MSECEEWWDDDDGYARKKKKEEEEEEGEKEVFIIICKRSTISFHLGNKRFLPCFRFRFISFRTIDGQRFHWFVQTQLQYSIYCS